MQILELAAKLQNAEDKDDEAAQEAILDQISESITGVAYAEGRWYRVSVGRYQITGRLDRLNLPDVFDSPPKLEYQNGRSWVEIELTQEQLKLLRLFTSQFTFEPSE